jgi:ankyrin repeat protein
LLACINSRDGDGHTLLDLAVMLNHTAMVRLLQLYGGIETDKCKLDGKLTGLIALMVATDVDPHARKVRLEVILRAKQVVCTMLQSLEMLELTLA